MLGRRGGYIRWVFVGIGSCLIDGMPVSMGALNPKEH